MKISAVGLFRRGNEEWNMDDGIIEQKCVMPIFSAFEQLAMIRGDHEVSIVKDSRILQLIQQSTEFRIHVGEIFIILEAVFIQ